MLGLKQAWTGHRPGWSSAAHRPRVRAEAKGRPVPPRRWLSASGSTAAARSSAEHGDPHALCAAGTEADHDGWGGRRRRGAAGSRCWVSAVKYSSGAWSAHGTGMASRGAWSSRQACTRAIVSLPPLSDSPCGCAVFNVPAILVHRRGFGLVMVFLLWFRLAKAHWDEQLSKETRRSRMSGLDRRRLASPWHCAAPACVPPCVRAAWQF